MGTMTGSRGFYSSNHPRVSTHGSFPKSDRPGQLRASWVNRLSRQEPSALCSTQHFLTSSEPCPANGTSDLHVCMLSFYFLSKANESAFYHICSCLLITSYMYILPAQPDGRLNSFFPIPVGSSLTNNS